MFSLAKTFDDERFKRIVAVLIALLTVLAALIALLQSDASARDDRANRDTKRYATEAMGRKVSGDARVNFDYNSAYQAWYELDTLATSATNRGDDEAAQRYITQRDEMTSLSPLLAAQYFDPAEGQPDVSRYEADVYLVEITALNERFLAASVVKDGWDTKANAYVFHLTLLAVAFFLFGLSITIASSITRWIFAGVGAIAAVVVVSMAANTWLQPVFDLRESGDSINAYANGVGLAHQDRWPEAITAFDQSIQSAPAYTNALVARAQAQGQQGNHEQAIADYERARAAGNESASVAGELAWAYYLQNRFDDATAMNRTALAASPDELWIQFDLGLGLLASGQIDTAKAEYTRGMEFATKQVADARAAGNEVPSFLWWSLDDAALQIDTLMAENTDGTSASTQTTASGELMQQLKSLAVGLENNGKPPEGAVAGTISPFEFSAPATDEEGNVAEPLVGDIFPEGTDEVLVTFDYDAMQDGQEVFYKVYIDGEEDPSWRLIGPWDLGTSGTAEKPLSLTYSDVFVLNPGEYTVEVYVASHLAQRGSFTIEGN